MTRRPVGSVQLTLAVFDASRSANRIFVPSRLAEIIGCAGHTVLPRAPMHGTLPALVARLCGQRLEDGK